MTNASSSNAPPSDAALPTVSQKTRQYNTTDEGMFLRQQAADAKAAMLRTVADIKATAQEAADVCWWTQQYPWYAVGTAALVGFITATQVLAPAEQDAQAAPPAARPSWMASLFELVRSALLRTVVEVLHSSSQPSERAQTRADSALD
jgi:hypothetical protein